jgi:hypothetical protein
MLQRYNNIRLERTIKAKQNHIKIMEERKNQQSTENVLTEAKSLLYEPSLEYLIEKYYQPYTNLDNIEMPIVNDDTLTDEMETECPIKMEMKKRNKL